MTKLSQIIAVEKGVKSDATRRVTDLHRDVQKQPLLSGISRREDWLIYDPAKIREPPD